ncbi:MAG: UMP kinase [Patescibacteria group bacterium]
MKYKRILLKLSGEQFAGSRGHGIDAKFVSDLAEELKDLLKGTNVQVAVVVGGGNIMRGAKVADHGVERATGDYMGMLATIINGMALTDTLEARGQPARLQSSLRVDSVAEPFIRRRAMRHMEKGRVVILAGGTGNPFFTTDTAAVKSALELDCDVVLKATKVDGVYDKDPALHSGAKKYDSLTHAEALRSPEVNVMDNAAVALAMDNQLPIIVFELKVGNLKKVVMGESIGTKVSHQK